MKPNKTLILISMYFFFSLLACGNNQERDYAIFLKMTAADEKCEAERRAFCENTVAGYMSRYGTCLQECEAIKLTCPPPVNVGADPGSQLDCISYTNLLKTLCINNCIIKYEQAKLAVYTCMQSEVPKSIYYDCMTRELGK